LCLWGRTALALSLVLAGAGCSLRSMAVNTIADTLAESSAAYASDNDPELVRSALPFSLKTIESLLVTSPNHKGLLLSACSGFASYANLFIDTEAVLVEYADFARAAELKARALKMYVRARDYCLRRLELGYAGITRRLQVDPHAAVQVAGIEDVPVLFWLGATWGLAISRASGQPALAADLPAVRALMERALQLDEGFDRGAIHGAMIVLEALPEAMGASPDRARRHFERAVELSDGLSAGPYVTYASSVLVAQQNRKQFVELLERALAIDPDAAPPMRLQNLISQELARHLLTHVDDLFLEALEENVQ